MMPVFAKGERGDIVGVHRDGRRVWEGWSRSRWILRVPKGIYVAVGAGKAASGKGRLGRDWWTVLVLRKRSRRLKSSLVGEGC